MTCSCIYFLEPYTIFFSFIFNVFRITYNKFMGFFLFVCLFHNFSLNCMALFFLSLLMMIFFSNARLCSKQKRKATEKVVGGWVGRWCWVASSAGLPTTLAYGRVRKVKR